MVNDQPIWSGIPRPDALIRDSLAATRAQIATTITLVLVLATVCFAILVTTGQAAANEAQIISQIDSAGTRVIVLFDQGGDAEILSTAPAGIEMISDVSWAIGLGEAVDVVNPLLPDGRAASRQFVGGLPPELPIVRGRAPRPGEAIVGVSAAPRLNLGIGLGAVQAVGVGGQSAIAGLNDPVGVVGVFDATGPLASLLNTVLIAAEPGDIDYLRFVYVMADNVNVIDRLETVLATATPANNLTALIVETPSGAIAVRELIAGNLGAAGRQLMAVIMGVGAVLIAVTMFAATINRRREFGRRRALGATRSTLIVALLLQTAVAAVLGILLGTVSGLVVLWLSVNHLPLWQFTFGVTGLAFLLTLLAATPVAANAANRDPLRILRVA